MGPMNAQSSQLWGMQPRDPNQDQIRSPGQFGGGFSSLRPNTIPTIYGKRVNTENDIAPNEVPMDGSIALFLANDLTCIFAKAWNSQGGIDTVRFVPEKPIQQPATDNNFQQEIFARLDRIEKEVKRKPYYNKKTNQKREDEQK